MTTRRTATMACLLLLASSTAVFAEDSPVIDAPEVTISASRDAAGAYLRLDGGYTAWRGDRKPAIRSFDAGSGITTSQSFDNTRFARPLSGTVGLGYRFNDVMRADLTGDYFESRFSGAATIASPCTGQAAGTGCAIDVTGWIKTFGLMANGYVDIGTLAGFTPYVGAGLGATRITGGNFSSTSTCLPGAGACGGAAAIGDHAGLDSWRMSYALMAGVSYDVTDRIKLDLGYRFAQVAGGNLFGYDAAETAAGATGAKAIDDGLTRHEFRAGLRISLW